MTVTAGATTTAADFALGVAVAQLEEVVTTATGQQRKVELGNAISTLGDVGKRVEEIARSQRDRPDDREVRRASACCPARARRRADDPHSRHLVDQLEQRADLVRRRRSLSTSARSSSRRRAQTPVSLLNNLNPEEIEDIEIVKGPSAATLYGTTRPTASSSSRRRRAAPAATHWNWYGRGAHDRRSQRTIRRMYANFGHTPANPATAIRCQLATMMTPQFSLSREARRASPTASRTTTPQRSGQHVHRTSAAAACSACT